MKCQFGYRKVRYRGIAKNGAQVFSLLALANLYLARRKLASRDGGRGKSPRRSAVTTSKSQPSKKNRYHDQPTFK